MAFEAFCIICTELVAERTYKISSIGLGLDLVGIGCGVAWGQNPYQYVDEIASRICRPRLTYTNRAGTEKGWQPVEEVAGGARAAAAASAIAAAYSASAAAYLGSWAVASGSQKRL